MIMNARREGFAVPMAILLIGVITAGVVGAFARVESENAVVNNVDAQSIAYAHAESGIGEYLSERNFPADMTFAFPGGGAQVRVEQLRADDGVNGALYMVHSTGVALQGSALPPAQHSVVQLAWLVPYTMSVPAGWTSLSGISKQGGAGEISGNDVGGGIPGNKPGVAVPDGGYTQSGGKIDNTIFGDPIAIDEMGSPDEMRDAIPIDWDGILNGGEMDFDVTVTAANASTWSDDVDFETWPVIYVGPDVTDFVPPKSGKGMLVVHNNLIFNGNQSWDGIVLVGGQIVDNGTGQVNGAVISGLNAKLKDPATGEWMTPPPSSRAPSARPGPSPAPDEWTSP